MLRYRTVASAHTFLVAGLGQAYAFAGMKSDAEQILRGLRDKAHAILRFSVRYRADLHRPWRKGTKAVAERSTFLVYSKWEPRLNPLHADPRFGQMLRKIGLSN